MSNSKTYTVLSPIKLGGAIVAIGDTIELTPAAAALLPAGRVKIVGDHLDELLEKPAAEIQEVLATMPLDEIGELGRREEAKGEEAREELLGAILKAFATRRRAEDEARDQERAKAKEKADAEAKAKAEAEAKSKADAESKAGKGDKKK